VLCGTLYPLRRLDAGRLAVQGRAHARRPADELDEAVALSRFSAAQAEAIRAEGARAVEAIETRDWPYSDGWERWAPPADWGIPSLPADRDLV
jgi:hypothetical protein